MTSRPAVHAPLLRLKWRLAFDRWEQKLACWVQAAKAGFDPNQPRVPAGNSDGGQWASGGGGSNGGRRRTASGRDDGRVLSDATPDDFTKPGSRLAQARPPGRGPSIRAGRRRLPATPGQRMRFGIADRRAKRLIKRVKDLDPTWKPQRSVTDPTSANGAIAIRRGEASEAEGRLRELARQGLGPGPFAKESIPARSPSRRFTIDERREINRIGSETNCHTCGSATPGTPSGNFVPDHQLPNALNPAGRAQRLYPQCFSCSRRQGGHVSASKRRGKK